MRLQSDGRYLAFESISALMQCMEINEMELRQKVKDLVENKYNDKVKDIK